MLCVVLGYGFSIGLTKELERPLWAVFNGSGKGGYIVGYLDSFKAQCELRSIKKGKVDVQAVHECMAELLTDNQAPERLAIIIPDAVRFLDTLYDNPANTRASLHYVAYFAIQRASGKIDASYFWKMVEGVVKP